MARPGVAHLPIWDDCQRCDRRRTRLGVLAPTWPAGVRVVVLGLAASRAAQGTGTLDPDLLRDVEQLRAELRLASHECIADVLVSCGLGDAAADHVAACSARFSDQQVAPEVVVLHDPRTFDLATRAGLLQGNPRVFPSSLVGHATDLAFLLREGITLAGVTRPELTVPKPGRLLLRVHDLRGSFVTLALATGRTEAWVTDRTGHRSSQMIYLYKRASRTAAELGLGWFAPLDEAIPELAPKPRQGANGVQTEGPNGRQVSRGGSQNQGKDAVSRLQKHVEYQLLSRGSQVRVLPGVLARSSSTSVVPGHGDQSGRSPHRVL